VKILVTGGAGFIGSNLVRSLLQRGDSVRILDDFSSPGGRERLGDVLAGVEILEGDLRDAALCARACEGADAVLHHAAVSSVARSVREPLLTHEVNAGGTLGLLLAARAGGVRRFVLASSAAVYGDLPEEVKVETLAPAPVSPYGASKLAAEAYARAFTRTYGLETVSLRYFNVFGPRQDPGSEYASVVPRFITALLAGKRPVIYGNGEQTRDFTYVEDVVRANLLALECPPAACGRVFNIGCGAATAVNELFRMLRERIGGKSAKLKPVYEPRREGDVSSSLASTAQAAQDLGYVPTTDIAEGIRLTVDWFRAAARGEEGQEGE
jgi:nucleoside-diphosphate-sugar epimerase